MNRILSKIQNIKIYKLLSQPVLQVILHIGYRAVLHYENCEMSTRLPSTGVVVAQWGRLGAYIFQSDPCWYLHSDPWLIYVVTELIVAQNEAPQRMGIFNSWRF